MHSGMTEVRRGKGIRRRLSLVTNLPCRGCSDFTRSFGRICTVRPSRFRLKFLGMLRKSIVRRGVGRCRLLYRGHPPCRILSAG